jgi:effector-binding domain-containing protein
MIDTPRLIQTIAQHTAFIHLSVTCEEMQHLFGPTIGELMAALGAQGVAPAGPVFAHHLRCPDETFDFELGVPVAAPVTAAGRLEPGIWPAQLAARTSYSGPYERLPDAWGEFTDWISAHGHQPADDLYEAYVTGPHSSPDPANWRTELTRPLKE